MTKITILLTRKNDLSHEEFLEYWTQKHTPLLAELPEDEVTVLRYVQQSAIDDSIPGVATAEVDAIAEL